MRIIITAIVLFVFSMTLYFTFMKDDVSISRLTTNPQKFDGKSVFVKGIVSSNLGLLGLGGYLLENNGHYIAVITDKGIPPKGVEVNIEGLFKQGLSFGEKNYSVLIQNENIDISKLFTLGILKK